ncbi:oxygen tolerance protein BatD [Dyadobacter jejuensis]|uniref:Oxygen tolerance protein BatD n=1 Tax=Dyadobacter jejuensis TaxID=1082580 RepID=A0A316ARL8_9BACT|nr:BatD family protein [Dyadobacter jejuensis]PWJ59969.1 oxygen tolerance protein BatD [Dyadobacter jejuensis]
MKVYILACIISFIFCTIQAQTPNNSAKIVFNGEFITLSDPLVISVVLTDTEKRPSITFPDIDGLEKRSKSATSRSEQEDGKTVVIQKISQEYFASKAGKYIIPAFSLRVNGQNLKSEQRTVVFSEREVEQEQEGDTDLLLPALTKIDNCVFFSVYTDKKMVYIREGFSLGISLYISEDAPVEMEFYRFNEQLQAILTKVKPLGCWEENIGIEEIVKRRVRIQGRFYTEYNMYRANFFPLKLEDINIPSVGLNMLVVDRKGTVNVETKVVEPFYSRAFSIGVKPLPAHPLRDRVAVGAYRLEERLSNDKVYPGESIRYQFKIVGQGNIVGIPAPDITPSSAFDFYAPELSQEVRRTGKGVSGEKGFEYFVVPRKDGTFPLSRYFQWVYFNNEKEKYDTLRSALTLQVLGADYMPGRLSEDTGHGLYDNLEGRDTSLNFINYSLILKNLSNLVVILLLLVLIWIFRK